MTETQLRLYPGFENLPVYDESDPRSYEIAFGYQQQVRECSLLQDVESCLADPKLIPLGGVRVGDNGQQVVIAFFGARG